MPTRTSKQSKCGCLRDLSRELPVQHPQRSTTWQQGAAGSSAVAHTYAWHAPGSFGQQRHRDDDAECADVHGCHNHQDRVCKPGSHPRAKRKHTRRDTHIVQTDRVCERGAATQEARASGGQHHPRLCGPGAARRGCRGTQCLQDPGRGGLVDPKPKRRASSPSVPPAHARRATRDAQASRTLAGAGRVWGGLARA